MRFPFVRISELRRHVGQTVVVRGWVMHVRSSGKIGFAVLRDGSGTLQTVVAKNAVSAEAWERFGALTQESAVQITGEVREDKRAPGGYELGASDLELLGPSPIDYPIQPKEHGVDFLLDHRHLWIRSPRQAAILRVRHEIEQAIHNFFYERDFIRVDTPILTAAIGERSGLFSTEYFDEFWMIEPEVAFNDSNDNMRLQEDFVSYLVQRCLERRRAELDELERDTSKLERVVPPFPRLEYSDAVPLLQGKGSAIQWGEDLGAEDEALLVEDYDRPVFVCNYPKQAKAFYMKENPADPRTVLCDDLLAPEGYGEIIGGSQREDDYDKVRRRIEEEGLPIDAYSWYLDLRKYGTFPHSGFGLGLERTVAWICGLAHIRETIPFPRLMNRLRP